MKALFTTSILFLVSSYTFAQTQDSIKKETTQSYSSVGTNPVTLNGYYVLQNKYKQKTKEGTFKENRLMDGKAYIYKEDGTLDHVAVYKGGIFVGESKKDK